MKQSALFTGVVPAMLAAFSPWTAIESVAQDAAVIQQRPNIIWISTEDFSPHLGCYGDQLAPAILGLKQFAMDTRIAMKYPVRLR